jgi:PAS domain S-box-containing protein
VESGVREGRQFQITYRIRTPAGREKWVMEQGQGVFDAEGRLEGLEGFIMDITERTKAEETLRLSEARFRALADTSPLAIYMSEGLEQRAIYINPTFTSLLGYTLTDVPSAETWWPRAYPDPAYRQTIAEQWQRRVAAAITSGSELEPMETVVTCKDGSHKHIRWGFKTIGEQNWAFGLDLTERREAEAQVQQVLDALARTNEELERFAYVVSHDLQEPLRMIMSYTQLLERRYRERLDEQGLEFMHYAVDGAQRMQQMLNGMLTYSRVNTRGWAPIPTDAGSAVGEVLANLRLSVQKTGAVVQYAALPWVMADPGQLLQLLQNLISNALKFSPGAPPRVEISAAPDGPHWRFAVRDQGIGFDPLHAERIFQVFQRLHGHDEYPGTGIGLAVCKKIVERHGGHIWVESAPGAGATFFFTLPGAPPATGEPAR